MDPNLLSDHNPTGADIKIGNKPRGIRRINPVGVAIAAGVFTAAVIIGVASFNQDDPAQTTNPAADHIAQAPRDNRQDWYSKVPDNLPSAPPAPAGADRPNQPTTSTLVSAAQVTNVTHPLQAPGTAAASATQTDTDAIRLHEVEIHATEASLSASGFTEAQAVSQPVPSSTSTRPALSTTPGINIPQQPQDDPNLQANKDRFLEKAAQAAQDYNPSTRVRPLSPYELKAGSIIPGLLIGGANSDLPGDLIGQVRENVYDSATGRYLLIPQGTKLFGHYDAHVAYGQTRILVAWQRLIYPDGSSVDLHGMHGGDVSGYAGFEDQVDNHYLRLFGSAILMSAISAGVELSQPPQTSPAAASSYGQTATAALGQQLGQTGTAITQRNLNIQPTLSDRPGYPFVVMVTADLILPPDGVPAQGGGL